MAIVVQRESHRYIEKTILRLCIFADVPSLTSLEAIADAFKTWRYAFAPVQAETLATWLQEDTEIKAQNCPMKLSVKVYSSVSVTRAGRATVNQAKAVSPGVQLIRRLLAAYGR